MPVTRRWFPFVQFEFTHSLGPQAGRYMLEAQPDPAERQREHDRAVRGARAGGEGRRTAAAQAAATGGAAETPAGGGAATAVDDDHAVAAATADGRVPVRTEEEEREQLLGSADVLVIQIQGAPAAKKGLFKRGQRTVNEGDEPEEVPLNVVTIIRGQRMLSDERAGEDLVRGLDDAERERWVAEGIRDVNRAVAAYRVSAADPYVFDVSRADPRLARIGYGIAEEVFAGKWTRATAVPQPKAPKVSRQLRLAPSQGAAALLAGTSSAMESEELVLRAVLDLDQGRLRAAAVGLQAGLELLLGELASETLPGRVRMQVDEIGELRQPLSVLAAQARRADLGATAAAALAEHAEQIGATIDRWRYEPLGY